MTVAGDDAGVLGGIVLWFLPALGDFATAQFLGDRSRR